jgi:hypothetical protein
MVDRQSSNRQPQKTNPRLDPDTKRPLSDRDRGGWLLPALIIGIMVGARSLGNYTERCHIKCEMKAPRIRPAVLELAALSALAALGCGLAAAQGDLWFVTVFGAASLVAIIEAVRRLL